MPKVDPDILSLYLRNGKHSLMRSEVRRNKLKYEKKEEEKKEKLKSLEIRNKRQVWYL